jgi:uncharacterized protein (DUF58 family)
MKKLDYLILIPTDPTYVPSDEQAEAGADALEALLPRADEVSYDMFDDVRFIDWKVSARNSNIHLKTFEEERNSLIYVLLDISPTMFYGSNKTTKLQASLEICALLYLLTQKTNDQLTLILLINNQSFTLPPLKGKMGIVSLVKQLEKLEV